MVVSLSLNFTGSYLFGLISFLHSDLVFGWFLFSFLGVWISISLNSKILTVKVDYCGSFSIVATWP